MIVEHKKGEPSGSRYFNFVGWCPSYWAEDGWHDTETMKVVSKPEVDTDGDTKLK